VWNESGDGSNFLCLPEEPQYKTYFDGTHEHRSTGFIQGVEYGLYYHRHWINSPFHTDNTNGVDLLKQPAPCAFCYVEDRSTVAMIPAMTECPAGWNAEYGGYLMSETHGSTHGERKRSTYLCWDESPEIAADGGSHHDQSIVYPVEVQCGTLPCSKYISGRELPCMVCSK